MRVENLKEFDIRDENIVSFEKVGVEIPFLSLISKESREINLNIHKPEIILNDKLLKKVEKGKPVSFKLPFRLNRINVIDGKISFTGKKIFAEILNVHMSSFTRARKTMIRIRSPHMKVIFPISRKEVKIEGDMIAEVRPQRTNVKISRLLWNTADFRLTLNGRYFFKEGNIALNAFIKGEPDKILEPALKKLRPQGYMEGSAKIRRKGKETLYIDAEATYNYFSIGGEVLDNLTGTILWNSLEKQINVDAQFEDMGVKSKLKVFSRPKLTRVQGENLRSNRVARVIKIDKTVPMDGIIKSVNFRIKKRVISGSAEVVAGEDILPDRFNMTGKLAFRYHTKEKWVNFSGTNVTTEFGTVSFLDGVVDPSKRVNLTLNGRAVIDEIGLLDKYTKYYIKLDFSRWKLRGGNGALTMDLKKIGKKYFMEGDIEVRDFTSVGRHIDTMSGHVSTKDSLTTALFRIDDKDIHGSARIFVGKKYYTVDFNNLRGESRKVMNILELNLDLSGPMEGNFHLEKQSDSPLPHITGQFEAPWVNFYDYIFKDVKGELDYRGHVALNNLSYTYKEGRGATDFFIDYGKQTYRLKGEIKGINILQLQPAFSGRVDLAFDGNGGFDIAPIRFTCTSGPLNFYEDRSFTINGRGSILTDFANFRIQSQGRLLTQDTASPFDFHLNRMGPDYSGGFKVTLNDINQLIPWGNNQGTVELDGEINSNRDGSLSTEGHATVMGRVLSFPNFPHVLENYQGDIIFRDLNFSLRSLTGAMGGGSVEANGVLQAGAGKLQDLSINMKARGVNLYFIDRTSFTLNGDLNLKYLNEKLLLSGNLHALSGIWEREVDEGIAFSTDPSLSKSGSKILDLLEFDLKLTAGNNIRIDNSFGRATGTFNLKLTGTRDFPVIMGDIQCNQGVLYFSDKKFDLLKAKIVFNNRFSNDPVINVESEAFIKNYRVKFNVKGTAFHAKPELQSTPPLPPRDILTLISLGELFERPTSSQLSSNVGTGTTGVIASTLTDQITKRTKKLFGDYMLKIDPNISSDISGTLFEDTSRLIVGKEIAKDLLVVYATDFSSQKKQVVYLQYQLSPSVSLIGTGLIGAGNEKRRYSLELRFRKRR